MDEGSPLNGVLRDISKKLDAITTLQNQSSSFFGSPVSPIDEGAPLHGVLRRQGARSRRVDVPIISSRYALEIDNKLIGQDFISYYYIMPDKKTERFVVLEKYGQQGHKEVVFECDGSNAMLKAVYLIFGMLSFDFENFLEYIRDNPNEIKPNEELSPEYTNISFYGEKVSETTEDEIIES